MRNRRLVLSLALALSACAREPAPEELLADLWRDTERFHDLEAARAAGYTVWSPDPNAADATCMTTAEGRMGYHLVNPALRGSPTDPANADADIDPRRPEMLLYEKRPDGEMVLVGVEYLVFEEAWEREHGADAAPPRVLGQTMPGMAHPFPPTVQHAVPHYELHVWLWRPNPNGRFAHFNPDVSC